MTDDPALSHLESLVQRVESLALRSQPVEQLHAEDYTIGPGFLMYGRESEPDPEPSWWSTFLSGVSTGLVAIAVGCAVLLFMLLTPTFL